MGTIRTSHMAPDVGPSPHLLEEPPQLMWSGQVGQGNDASEVSFVWPDSNSHTDRINVGRKCPSTNRAIVPFLQAIVDARECVWILDGYFGEDECEWLVRAMAYSDVPDLCIFSAYHSEMATWASKLRTCRPLNRGSPRPQLTVEWFGILDTHLFRDVHDRFAVVDGELWHFGGTVGGVLAAFTAQSRGWSAHDTEATARLQELREHARRIERYVA